MTSWLLICVEMDRVINCEVFQCIILKHTILHLHGTLLKVKWRVLTSVSISICVFYQTLHVSPNTADIILPHTPASYIPHPMMSLSSAHRVPMWTWLRCIEWQYLWLRSPIIILVMAQLERPEGRGGCWLRPNMVLLLLFNNPHSTK
jgi:hypothetical protein